VRPKPQPGETLAGFVEASKKYRGPDVEFELTPATLVTTRPSPFDEDGS
jgi:hypothetical protein